MASGPGPKSKGHNARRARAYSEKEYKINPVQNRSRQFLSRSRRFRFWKNETRTGLPGRRFWLGSEPRNRGAGSVPVSVLPPTVPVRTSGSNRTKLWPFMSYFLYLHSKFKVSFPSNLLVNMEENEDHLISIFMRQM